MDGRSKLFHLSPLQRRVPIILSLGLVFLMIAPADPARAEETAATKVYGQTIGNWGHAWWQWAIELCRCGQPDRPARECRLLCWPVWQGLVPRRNIRRPGGAHLLDKEGQGDFLPGVQWYFLDTRGLYRRDELPTRRGQPAGRPHELDLHSRRYPLRLVHPDRPCAVRCPAVRDPGWINLHSPRATEALDRRRILGHARPATSGTHKIHFTSEAPSFDFSLAVTYHVTVK